MATGDKQRLITSIVAEVLNEEARTDITFDWFINKHDKEYFGKHFTTIDKIFSSLGGDKQANQTKRTTKLKCDAYFGGQNNFIFEFDEYQHFSSARLKTLEFYPTELELYFDIDKWKKYCNIYKDKADKYRKNKTASGFEFEGGRTAQRAYLDCFRDLLPEINGLRPTVRISEFEVASIFENNKEAYNKVEKLLKSKIR